MNQFTSGVLLGSLLLPSLTNVAFAGLVVDPGIVRVPEGATTVQVPVRVTGGDLITDMAGLVEAGSPPAAGLTIQAVSLAGSIWNGAPGGFTSFFTPAPPATTVGPNVSLNVAGQTVSGHGLLMTLTVNIAGRGVGDYPVRLANTQGGSTVIVHGLQEVATTFLSGLIRIVDGIEAWQLTEFAASVADPALEATVWGDLADPDGDGLSNLMEYYLGTNPRVPTLEPASAASAGRPSFVLVDSGGQTFAALGFTRRKQSGVVTALTQSSDTLVSWIDSAFVEAAPPAALPGGVLEYVVRRLTTPIPPGSSLGFLRLKVIRR